MERFFILLKMFAGGFVLLYGVGCSQNFVDIPFVVPETAVSQDRALIVLGIQWQEKFDDLQEERQKNFSSEELFSQLNEKDFLSSPQYYFSQQRFFFHNRDTPAHSFVVVKSTKEKISYEKVTLHAVHPGFYELNAFTQDQEIFSQKAGSDGGVERRHKSTKNYPIPSRRWKLEPGKIYYLGDLGLYFLTKKLMFGLFPREQLNQSIDLEKVQWRDNFHQIQASLKKSKPWFPAEAMLNLSQSDDKKEPIKRKQEVPVSPSATPGVPLFF